MSSGKNLLVLFGWIVLCFGASAMGIFFPPGDWYATLNKPSWNPPSWLFGPVWTALYLMMGVAAWRIWRLGGWTQQRRPLSFFLAQLFLNALWTPLFFGLHWPGVAYAEILCLWALIAATCRAFLPRRQMGGGVVAALSRVGVVRGRPECRALAVERLIMCNTAKPAAGGN